MSVPLDHVPVERTGSAIIISYLLKNIRELTEAVHVVAGSEGYELDPEASRFKHAQAALQGTPDGIDKCTLERLIDGDSPMIPDHVRLPALLPDSWAAGLRGIGVRTVGDLRSRSDDTIIATHALTALQLAALRFVVPERRD